MHIGIFQFCIKDNIILKTPRNHITNFFGIYNFGNKSNQFSVTNNISSFFLSVIYMKHLFNTFFPTEHTVC